MRTNQRGTYDEALKYFSDHNCKLLEETYTNSHAPMRFRCKCGKIGVKKFYAFKKHPFCDSCAKTGKLTEEELRQRCAEHKCEFLARHGNCIEFRCRCGRTDKKTISNFRQYPQCRYCSKRHAYTLEEVKSIFEKAQCTLLAISYENYDAKMPYICKCGRKSTISLDKFVAGHRCSECGLRKGAKNGRWNPDRELVKLNQDIAIRSLGYLKRTLKMHGKKKEQTIRTYLGYTVQDLRNRITNHPNWPQAKEGTWHIDHIFPINAFLKYGVTDLKIINSLENLRPLLGKDNLKKRCSYNEQDFRYWLSTKGISTSLS